MAPIPEPQRTIRSLIDAQHEKSAELPRPHMGASQLGHHCERWLWLSFRWAVIEKFPGRIRRLFRRGHEEEKNFISDLEMIGVKFENHQEYIDFGGHVGGSTDGTINSGVPGAERTRHVAEFKTHSEKSFSDLQKKGVLESKPMHWAQMQLYMLGTRIDRALYVAVCKNDDQLYTERVNFDKEAAEKLLQRGKRLAKSERMPEPISTDPSWYQCKFCAAHSFCHETKLTKEVNCRTCAHATPEDDSSWSCARWESANIPVEWQHKGCDSHVLHPDLVPWQRKPSNDSHEAVYEIGGKDIRNGEADAFCFGSKEIIIGGEDCANGAVQAVRKEFPGSKIEEADEVPF
jgi:hypothetical protein